LENSLVGASVVTRSSRFDASYVERSGFKALLEQLHDQEEARVGKLEENILRLNTRDGRVGLMLEAIENADATRMYESDIRECQADARGVNDDDSEFRFLETTRRVMIFGNSELAECYLEYGHCLRRYVLAASDYPSRDGQLFEASLAKQNRLVQNIVECSTAARKARSPNAKLAFAVVSVINTSELLRSIVLRDMHSGLAGSDPRSYKALKRFLSMRWHYKIRFDLFEVRNALVHGDVRTLADGIRIYKGRKSCGTISSHDMLRYGNVASVAWSAVLLHVLFSRAWKKTGNPWFSPKGRLALRTPYGWGKRFPEWIAWGR
jgi:hypothetical protein